MVRGAAVGTEACSWAGAFFFLFRFTGNSGNGKSLMSVLSRSSSSRSSSQQPGGTRLSLLRDPNEGEKDRKRDGNEDKL